MLRLTQVTCLHVCMCVSCVGALGGRRENRVRGKSQVAATCISSINKRLSRVGGSSGDCHIVPLCRPTGAGARLCRGGVPVVQGPLQDDLPNP
jgi:hypothetical protein